MGWSGKTWRRVCIYAETEGTLIGLWDSAMIRLMSDCLLRILEVVAVNVGDFKAKTLTLRSSKTDQEGVGETLYICDNTRALLKQYGEQAASHTEQCSDTFAAVGMFSRNGSQLSLHAASFRNAHMLRVLRVSYRGIPFVLGLLSPSPKREQLLSICKLQDDGNSHRCWRIMPKPNSPNAAQSQGSKMESDDQDTHYPFSSCHSLQSCQRR